MGQRADGVPARGLVLRALAAAGIVTAFLLLRSRLSPRALVTARFGVGVALFALLVDVGRTLIGADPPVDGQLRPHEQTARPLVDERYRRVHEPVKRFVDEGVWTSSYEHLLEEAFDAAGAPTRTRETVMEDARRAAEERRPPGPPVPLALGSGAIVVVGLAITTGMLLEALELPVTGPILGVLGLGLAILQVRAHDAGRRWTGLVIGLLGAGAVVLAGLRLGARSTGPWWIVQGMGILLALGTLALTAQAREGPPPWEQLEAELEERFRTLRRAFLAALLAGGVLFPFEPLLAELFTALGWPLDVPYRIVTAGYATLAAFVAVEMAAVWYGLSRGREEARRQRRRRIEANRAILEAIEARSEQASEQGGPQA